MLIDVYVNGEWDTNLEDNKTKSVTIYSKGIHYQMDSKLFDNFIDKLENTGYDCYFSPQLFSHPDWDGIIIYN